MARFRHPLSSSRLHQKRLTLTLSLRAEAPDNMGSLGPASVAPNSEEDCQFFFITVLAAKLRGMSLTQKI